MCSDWAFLLKWIQMHVGAICANEVMIMLAYLIAFIKLAKLPGVLRRFSYNLVLATVPFPDTAHHTGSAQT